MGDRELMKKFLTIMLIIALALTTLPVFQVGAEGEAQASTTTYQTVTLPEADSTFESGTTNWAYLQGGKVEIVNNPSGEGKVLAYKDCPDSSFASPIFNIKPAITSFAKKPGTIKLSFDLYTLKDLSCITRIRSAKGGFSLCGDKEYCQLGNVKVTAKTWTTVSYTFEILESDLKSTALNWNFCFDSISAAAFGSVIYIDNFSLTYLESDTYGMATSEEVQPGNILDAKNSTFESANKTNWTYFTMGAVSVVKNPKGEGRVLKYSECLNPNETPNNNTWASVVLNIKPFVESALEEGATLYIAFDVYTTGESGSVSFMVRTSSDSALGFMPKEATYANLGTVGFMKDKWKRVKVEMEVTDEDLAIKGGYWNICFNNTYKVAGEGTIYMDNVYIGIEPEDEETVITNAEKVQDIPIPEKTPITRGEKTLVGTIRWDAFTQSTPNGTNPASQVARVLSPKKYHYQAPFFANVEADDTISFPKYTMETWEQEAQYAHEGGIDYYAYIWYDTGSDMALPRQYHLLSKKKNLVKMTAALESIRDDATMGELFDAMKDSCYITLSGRPVLFLYGFDDWTKEDVQTVRQMAANAGIEKSLYIVGMTVKTTKINENINKGIDAISWYGVAAQKTAEPYADIAKRCEGYIETIGPMTQGFDFDLIPSFTTGRDSLARIETGVTWVDGDPNAKADKDKPYGNKYTIQPTMDELEAHIRFTYNYVQNNPDYTTPNMILSYGWNEHEEGGWFCPTLLCDKDGNLILDENGNKQANVERLKTLNKVLVDLRGDEAHFGNTPKAEATPTAAVKGNNENGGFNILYVVIPAIVVVVGGAAVVTVIVLKKKKTEEK